MTFHRWGWAGLAWLTLALFLFPGLAVLLGSLGAAAEGTLDFPWALMGSVFSDTGLLVFGTALVSVALGTGLAWIQVRYEFPGRSIFHWAQILPLSLPSFVALYAYKGFLEYTGPIAGLWRALTGTGPFWGPPEGLAGAMAVMGLTLYPYVYFSMRSFFKRLPVSLLENTAVAGWSRRRQFWQLVLPLARPALFGGTMLVLMEVLNEFGVPNHLGLSTFSTAIYRTWFSTGNLGGALALALLLLTLVLGFLGLELWQRGRRGFAGTADSRTLGQAQRLRPDRPWLLTLLSLGPLGLGFLIPTAQLFVWLGQTGLSSWAWLAPLGNSVLLGLGSALLGTLLAALLVQARALGAGGPWTALSPLLQLGYALPGAVLAIALLPSFGGLDRWLSGFLSPDTPRLFLTGSLFGLVVAYLIRFSAVAYQPLQAGGLQNNRSLTEAALNAGMRPWKVFWTVNRPLWSPAMTAAASLMLVDLLKELPLTLILRPFNFHTLATRVYDAAGNEYPAQGAFEALLLIGLAALGTWIAHQALESRRNR